MRKTQSIATEGPGRYLIEVGRKNLRLPFILMQFEAPGGDTRSLHMPATAHMSYLLRCETGGLRVHCRTEDVEHIGLRRIGRLAEIFLLRRKSERRFRVEVAQGADIVPLLRRGGREGKELRKAVRLISNWGFGLSSANLQKTPGLLQWQDAMPQSAAGSSVFPVTVDGRLPRFAVVLHLYYRDLWPEFEFHLRRIDQLFHLIVTTTQADAAFEARVRDAFPGAEIHVFENRGRDVGPFFQLLHDGRLDAYPFICKLHGKRSEAEGPRALLGEIWRRTNIADLIGSSEQVEKILRRFEARSHIGMIGSPRFRLPNEHIQHQSAWGENRDATLELAERMGISHEDFRLDFFAGTMFWIKQEALAPLRGLGLTLHDFAEENGALDGELPHALERAFSAAPQSIDLFLDNAPAMIGGKETQTDTPAAT